MRLMVSPVTHGLLTKDHPVIMRDTTILWGTEIVSVDPATGEETLLYLFDAGDPPQLPSRMDIAADGTIYVLHPGDDTIRVLTWDAGTGEYGEATLDTELSPAYDLSVGPDGCLYTFCTEDPSWFTGMRVKRRVFRVDPTDGSSSVHAYVATMTYVYSWTWDTGGKLWIGLVDAKKGTKYITEVVAGETTSSRSAISSSDYFPNTVTAGLEGRLYVLEHVDYGTSDSLWNLTPGSGGGGGKPPKKK
jgi:hypothetical protein